MVSIGKGRLFKRKDGKYMIYVPLNLATDSRFPFDMKGASSIRVQISFTEDSLIVKVKKEALK